MFAKAKRVMETSDQSISESYDNMGDEDGSLVLSSFSDDSSVSEEERASKRRKTEEGFEGTFKDPTRDEMTMFKETENLFKSSLFNLQVSKFVFAVLCANRVLQCGTFSMCFLTLVFFAVWCAQARCF